MTTDAIPAGYRPIASGEVFKRCAMCGAEYDLARWEALAPLGKSTWDDSDGGPSFYDFRNCPCGTTMAMELGRDKTPIIEQGE